MIAYIYMKMIENILNWKREYYNYIEAQRK